MLRISLDFGRIHNARVTRWHFEGSSVDIFIFFRLAQRRHWSRCCHAGECISKAYESASRRKQCRCTQCEGTSCPSRVWRVVRRYVIVLSCISFAHLRRDMHNKQRIVLVRDGFLCNQIRRVGVVEAIANACRRVKRPIKRCSLSSIKLREKIYLEKFTLVCDIHKNLNKYSETRYSFAGKTHIKEKHARDESLLIVKLILRNYWLELWKLLQTVIHSLIL